MQHRYGSLVDTDVEVFQHITSYPAATDSFRIAYNIPERFDGRDTWGTYLVPPSSTSTSSASWAIVAKNVLNDRFCLQSGGQLLTNFDEFEILSCIKRSHASGYGIFDAWEYLYQYGVCQEQCFPVEELTRRGLERPENLETVENRTKAYGKDCSLIEDKGRTRCLVESKGRPVARRAFLCDSFYRVGYGKTWEDTVGRIKAEIVRYGPVAAGFVIYSNFTEGLGNTDPKKWRGHTPYEKAEGRMLGGHYVSIVGWDGDYWICRNTWGSEWGLLGYVKIKMGIKECRLEDNISACMPYLYHRRDNGENFRPGEMLNGTPVNLYDMKTINPVLYDARDQLHIDFSRFYTSETLRQIQNGTLTGDMTPIIRYPLFLPDIRFFWVKDILDYSYPTLSGEATDALVNREHTSLLWWVLAALLFWLGTRL